MNITPVSRGQMQDLFAYQKQRKAAGATAPRVVMNGKGHTHASDPLTRFVCDTLHDLGVPYQQVLVAKVRLLARLRALLATPMGGEDYYQFALEVCEEAGYAAPPPAQVAKLVQATINCCREVEQGIAAGTFPPQHQGTFSIGPERIKL